MDVPLEDEKRIACFLRLLPATRIKNAIIPETNKHLYRPLSFGEFIKFLGLWVITMCFPGINRSKFFSTSTITSIWDGDSPVKLHRIMNSCRFEELNQNMQFTKNEFPPHKDKFHEVREIIAAFNDHMKKLVIPSWISYLDESMSPWTMRWNCPGLMCVPRKSHPMGNDHHIVACGVSGAF